MSTLERVVVSLLVIVLMAGNAVVWFEAPCGFWRAVSTAGKMPGRCQR